MMKKNIMRLSQLKAGFTLVEILLVLSIMLVIMATTIVAVPRYLEKREIENFLQQLSHDLHYAQALAMNHQSVYHVTMNTSSDIYFISQYTKRVFTREFPEGVTFMRGSSTMNSVIAVYSSGLLSESGTWFFKTEHYTYAFKIYLGEGRHTYHEQ